MIADDDPFGFVPNDPPEDLSDHCYHSPDVGLLDRYHCQILDAGPASQHGWL